MIIFIWMITSDSPRRDLSLGPQPGYYTPLYPSKAAFVTINPAVSVPDRQPD